MNKSCQSLFICSLTLTNSMYIYMYIYIYTYIYPSFWSLYLVAKAFLFYVF